jgi:peroxiredoxin
MAFAVPAWAHCGFCGKGDTGSSGEHGHSNAQIGKPAPDFALKDLDGKEHKLSDLKGKIVVLEWINHECPVIKRCHKSGIMSDQVKKFKGKPVTWLAIDSSSFCKDKADTIREWAKESKIDYPYLLDEAGKVGHFYGAKTTPHMFVIDAKGALAYAGAIDNDPFGQSQDKRNYVEEAVTALLNGSTVATTTTKPYGCGVKYNK